MLSFVSSTVPVTRHLKVLVYGGPGTGKTHFALHAPAPLVIDTESSTDAFRGRTDVPEFHVAKSAQPGEILDVLEHVQTTGAIQGITPQSIIVDSFSVLWQVRQEAGQKKAERNAPNPDTARVSYYDWSWIKRPIQRAYTQLVNMPLHVVLTAREKAIYDEIKDGSQTKLEIVDYAPDIERNAEYVFDVVLRLVVENGQRKAEVRKSRFPQFYIGQVIDDPTWSMFAALATTGEEQGTIPDTDEAAESESREPAAWTQQPDIVGKAEEWLEENGLSDSDVNTALDCEDWRTTHLTRDAFKTHVTEYIHDQVTQAVIEPTAKPKFDTRQSELSQEAQST